MAEPSEHSFGLEIGVVVDYLTRVGVAVIDVANGTLKTGDAIWIKGHTTDLKQTVDSMQLDRAPVIEAKGGQQVAIKVQSRVRRHDRVYKL